MGRAQKRDTMSEALSRIQIEQFQRRKEAAAVNEKLTELNHDLEQHVAETEKTKAKLDHDIKELERVDALYEQTVADAKAKMVSGEEKLTASRQLLQEVATKSNAEYIETLKMAHSELTAAQQAKQSLDQRAKKGAETLRSLMAERKSNQTQFEKKFNEGKEQIARIDLDIRHHLQKTSTLGNDLARVDARIAETEAEHGQFNMEVAKGTTELERLLKLAEEQEKLMNEQASNLQDLESRIEDTNRHIKFVNDIHGEEYAKRMEKRTEDLAKAEAEIEGIEEEKATLETDLLKKRNEVITDNNQMERLGLEARVEDQKKNEANRKLIELKEREKQCESKLAHQEETITATRVELEKLNKQRTENREQIFLTKEDMLDKDEEMRRQQRKINRIQASISDLQNDQVWDELEAARNKSSAQQEQKDAHETELASIKERQITMENELREVTSRECQMKTDHDRLHAENDRLSEQVDKSKHALGTKQSEEAELRSELSAMTTRLGQMNNELRQLGTDNDELQIKLGIHGTEADVVKLEDALETEKRLHQTVKAELDQANKSKVAAVAKQAELSIKVGKLKKDIESEEKHIAEARVALDHKRNVYNNQQQRKESYVLISGSIDAKRLELKSVKDKVDEKRKELSKKRDNNERHLAEISISSNAQVTAANEKEKELVAKIAKFLSVDIDSIADEGQDTLISKCQMALEYAEADNIAKENELHGLERQREHLAQEVEQNQHLVDEDTDRLRSRLKSMEKRSSNKENLKNEKTPVAKISARRKSRVLGTKSKTPGTSTLPRKKRQSIPSPKPQTQNLLDSSDASSINMPVTRPLTFNADISDDEIF